MTGGGGRRTLRQQKRRQNCQTSGNDKQKLCNLSTDCSSENIGRSSENTDSSSENTDSSSQNTGSSAKAIEDSLLDTFSAESCHHCFGVRFPAGLPNLFNSGIVSAPSHLAAAIKTILTFSSYAVASVFRFAKSLKIKLLPAFLFIFSLKKVLCNRLICKPFSADSFVSLGRYAPWKRGRLQRPHSGAILVLLALFIPILLGGIRYSQMLFKQRQKSIESLSDPNDAALYKECAREIALAVAEIWDPLKTLGEQKEAAYAIAKKIYNSYPCLQKGGIRSAIPGLLATTLSGDKIELPPSKKQFSEDYVKISIVNDDKYGGKIKVQTDYQVGYAVPRECNANVILAVPTNSGVSGSLSKIGAALGKFSENFSNIRGVYMGIVPYSGKLSIPSDRADDWTTKFPAFTANDAQQLLIGACLYATKGIKGTALTEQYAWDNGCPIMFRRGAEITDDKYCKNPYYSGILFSKDNPNNSIDKKYIQMDLRPCTLSNVSLLGMWCSSNCTVFSPNPHAMVEPMDDMTAFKTKCNALTSFNHTGNDSCFIFAALEWANNMLQSWTKDPQKPLNTNDDSARLGSQSKTAKGRKNYIILLANKPDYFKDGEMTYLGFSDDYKEKSMVEDDIITFSSSTTSSNGILVFSGSKKSSGNATCTLSFPRKHLVKIVAKPVSDSTDATITFTNISNKTKRLSKNTAYKFRWERDFYIDPEQITDINSDGKYQIKFTINNVELVSAKISNRTFSTYNPTCSKSKSGNNVTISANCRRPIKLTVTPKISYAKVGNQEKRGFLTDQTFTFTNQAKNAKLACTFENASFKSGEAKNIVPDEGTQTIFESLSLGTNKENIFNLPVKKGALCIFSVLAPINSWSTGNPFAGDYAAHINVPVSITITCCGETIIDTSQGYQAPWFSSEGGFYIENFKYEFNTTGSNPQLKMITGNDCSSSEGAVHYHTTGLTFGKCTVSWNNTKEETGTLACNNNTIDVQCGGTVEIVIKSDISPKISWIKDDSSSASQSFTEVTDVIIDPKEYKYEEQSDGTYKIKLTLTDDIVSLSNPIIEDQTALFKYGSSPTVGSNFGNVALSAYSGSNNSEKMRDATKKAYKGLSENTTVFLIQYNKQNTQNTDDYSYIGVPEDNITYNVTDSNLETVLEQIAERIKSSAGYDEAKNVP